MSSVETVKIIGGGLAGLSLGIALRKAGIPAKIFEAGDYPRHRVCGEFITGLDDDIIEKLDLGSVFEGCRTHRSVTWFVGGKPVHRHALPGAARAISRFALDDRLARLFVARGGELATRTRWDTSAVAPGWVDACGRRTNGTPTTWLGLKVHACKLEIADDLEFHLGDGAYVGLAPVEGGWTNICGLFSRRTGLQFGRDDALPAYLRASGLGALAERLQTASIRPGSRCAVAGFAIDRTVNTDEALRLGDACGTIPPFTGNGMAMAFNGAAIALEPLVAWARGEMTWEESTGRIHRELRQRFRLRLASASFLHPLLLNGTAQRVLGKAMGMGVIPTTILYRLTH